MNSGPSSGRSVGRPCEPLTSRRVQRDHVHQIAEAENLLRQPPGDARLGERQLRIEEQLHRVVARLAVDVHGAREVGRARLVEKVVVGEPAVGARDRHQLARARMVQPALALAGLVEHPLHAGQRLDQRFDLGHQRGFSDVDVRDLVIGHGEGARCASVEQLAPELLAHLDVAGLAQRAVDVHRLRDRRDAVLREHDHARAGALCRLDQLAAHLIDLRPRPARCADGRGPAAAGCSRGAAGTPASTWAADRSNTSSAQRPIQRLETMSAAGPQKRNSGNCPSRCCSSSRSPGGLV